MARKENKDKGILEWPPNSGKWWARIYVNGREKRYRCDSKSQARALHGRLRAEIREGTYFPEKYAKPKFPTLKQWIKQHLEGSTNKNIQNERRHGKFWSHLWGRKTIDQLTTEECRRIQAKLLAKGNRKPSTINRYFAFLRHVIMIAVKDGILDRNPVSGVRFFPEAEKVRYFSDEELKAVHPVMNIEDWRLVAFAVETGLRRAEQFSLRWDQISFDSKTLTIPLSKGGRTRHIPLTEEALGILRTLNSFLHSPWVFPGIRELLRPMDSRAFIRRSFEPALRKAGIQNASWHTLRHTTASRLVMAGVPLTTVREILGHRDIRTTLRYAHLAPDHIRGAIEQGSLKKLKLSTVSGTVTEEREEKEKAAQVLDLLARPEGVEPPTPGSEVRCSIH